MNKLSRRQFVVTAAAAAPLVSRLSAEPLAMPVGCQVWPVREALNKDFQGTLKQLAAAGFKTIEMCSPDGYSGAGFAPLAKMSGAEMRETINGAGLECRSSHFTRQELRDRLDARIGFAKELGLTQMVLATFGLRDDAPISDWQRAAQELNKIGEQTLKAGIQTGFHNHHNEFRKIDGILIYDTLLSELDPQLVKMQFQVAVISIGYKAADYLEKHPGRFISLHLADWSTTEKSQVPVGQGAVDWKGLYAVAKKGGVKNHFLEMELDLMKASIPYLRSLS
ncbi:MAG: sugar phosphate isomerase/epimerase [Acidobacteria bacterium]|nr:MAG: sugar phosphate isomerase/epimerase [Acidobacteriota bacterium]